MNRKGLPAVELIVEGDDVVTYYVRVWSDGETAATDLVITDEVGEAS